ncbi:hypothetical protein [Devosia sp. 2618]|uniref:hypothetical protein n=1 Tax=Devosia sp. 2618 TaxID=3156454 RepID=UPI003395AC49
MPDIIHWPAGLLTPQSSPFDPRPFSRSGGRSLGGISRSARSDRGFWQGSLKNIVFRRATQFDQARTWNAIRTALAGTSGLVAVPVCASRVWAADGFKDFAPRMTTHDDGTPFDDGTHYSQGNIDIEMASFAALGSTVINLRLNHAPTASGIRFSYQHAMYETGRILGQLAESVFQVEISTAIRAPIPASAQLEADRPTILCHLASDTEMDIEFPGAGMPRPSVAFVEAVDYWNDLAMGLVD